MDGLQTLSDLMTKYHVEEELFSQVKSTEASTELINASVELYSFIFEYQARCVCHLSLRSARRAVKDIFETNDRTGILEKIDKADKNRADIVALFDKSKEHTLQEQQAKQLTVQTRMFETFQDRCSECQQYHLEADLLTSLASDYESDKAAIPRRVDGTCEWFFRDERFHRWRDNASSSLLWISAGPGCGKSVLAKTLMDECLLSSATAVHTTTCYFFFKEGEEKRSKAVNAFSAILHQLFVQDPQLISNGLPSSKSFVDKLSNTFSELWKVLVKTAEDESAGHIICVLDALDECETQSTQMVIDKIIDYYSDRFQQRSSTVLKFLVTSRPYSRVSSAFEHLQGINEYVHFDGDECSTDIGNEINLVIDYKVPRMTQDFATQDRERISSRLKEMKHRTYLWLHLTLNIIDREQGKYSKASKIEKLLSHLPVDISTAYERILSQGSDINSARALLQIIIAANRPLTLAEANVALTIATQDEKPVSLDELDLWPEERFKSTVQDMCGLFVSVHDGKLSLIHQTARGFVLQAATDEISSKPSKDQKWSRYFTMECAHEVLCSICIEYLILSDITKQVDSSKQRKDFANASSESLVFFDYAARKWALHYKEAPHPKIEALQTRAVALCKLEYIPPAHWFPNYARKELSFLGMATSGLYEICHVGGIEYWSALGISSVLGLADIVQCLLAGATKVDHRAGRFGTATRAAIVMDHTDVLRVLCPFNTSARFQLDPRSDIMALQVPRARLSLSTETILQSSAKTRLSDDLSYAVALMSSLDTIRILLEHGRDPNVRNDEGETLLQSTICEHLLPIDHPSRIALSGSSRKHVISERHKIAKSFQLLLEFGADPNIPTKNKITPLQMALRGRCLPIVVSLLLRAGANVNITSAVGASPISLANWMLRRAKETGTRRTVEEAAETVQLLRDAGANEDLEEVTNWGEASYEGTTSDKEEASDEEAASDVAWGSDVAEASDVGEASDEEETSDEDSDRSRA